MTVSGLFVAILLGSATILLAAIAGASLFIAHQTMRRRVPDAPTNPRELGLDFEPVTFFSRDGLRLGGWFVPTAGRARGTIVLCHGHAGSLDADLHYVPAFHQHGYNVLQFDFRAHGRSEGQHVSMGYLERRDLLGAIDFLRARGISKVGVLGFSMGGAVAVSTAAECPSIVAIVSDGGFARILTTLQMGIQQRGVPPWLARILGAVVVRLVGWRLSCHLSDADPVDLIGRISPRPLLLIHGGRDRYVPASEVEMLYDSAGKPKELWAVPEAEHRQVDQVRPEEYITRVLAFFDAALAQRVHRK